VQGQDAGADEAHGGGAQDEAGCGRAPAPEVEAKGEEQDERAQVVVAHVPEVPLAEDHDRVGEESAREQAESHGPRPARQGRPRRAQKDQEVGETDQDVGDRPEMVSEPGQGVWGDSVPRPARERRPGHDDERGGP
jgi:hypothetical protein